MFLPSQLQNLPLSSTEVPGDGRMLTGLTLAGMLLCSQGPAGSPKTQPPILMSYRVTRPPAPGLPDFSLEASGLHGPSPLCSPCWNPPSPEPKGERCGTRLLCPPFSEKNTEQIYFCKSLICPAKCGSELRRPLVFQGFLLYSEGRAALSWDCPPRLPVRT